MTCLEGRATDGRFCFTIHPYVSHGSAGMGHAHGKVTWVSHTAFPDLQGTLSSADRDCSGQPSQGQIWRKPQEWSTVLKLTVQLWHKQRQWPQHLNLIQDMHQQSMMVPTGHGQGKGQGGIWGSRGKANVDKGGQAGAEEREEVWRGESADRAHIGRGHPFNPHLNFGRRAQDCWL